MKKIHNIIFQSLDSAHLRCTREIEIIGKNIVARQVSLKKIVNYRWEKTEFVSLVPLRCLGLTLLYSSATAKDHAER